MVRKSLPGELGIFAIRLEKAPLPGQRHEIARLLVGFDEATVPWLPLYWYLVRWVRLADQEAVKMLVEENEGR